MQVKTKTSDYVMFPITNAYGDAVYTRWVKVDRDDYPVVALYSWHLTFDSRTHRGYPQTRTKTLGNRSLGKFLLGESELGNFGRVDHINGNTMDHRRRNLAWATQEQILAKRRPPSGGHSRFKGVTWDRKQEKWLAVFRGAKIGRFLDERDAARAFDEAAWDYWKPQGIEPYLNFPRVKRGALMNGPRARRLTSAIDQCLITTNLSHEARTALINAQRAVEQWTIEPPLWIQPRAVNQ